jgi:hypothetical protein
VSGKPRIALDFNNLNVTPGLVSAFFAVVFLFSLGCLRAKLVHIIISMKPMRRLNYGVGGKDVGWTKTFRRGTGHPRNQKRHGYGGAGHPNQFIIKSLLIKVMIHFEQLRLFFCFKK